MTEIQEINDRIAAIDWARVEQALFRTGHANLGCLLSQTACKSIAASYDEEQLFRSRVVMARHGFGQGEYKYFTYPLPEPVSSLRRMLYGPLSNIANRWHQALGRDPRFPDTLDAYTLQCSAAGQTRPTPLLLRYGPGDYNRLHQDLYGEHVFPLQAVILLSDPERDFTGGHFVLTETRPRMQSRADVPELRQGEAIVFAVHDRPVVTPRGFARATLRHGVTEVRSGSRHTLGVIFHDAA